MSNHVIKQIKFYSLVKFVQISVIAKSETRLFRCRIRQVPHYQFLKELWKEIHIDGLVWFGLWCLTPLQQYLSYIVAISFIGGGN